MGHYLFNAIWENDLDTIKAFLDENPAQISIKDENGRSMISYAAQQGDVNTIKLLIKKGADINSCDEQSKETPLHDAIIEDNIEAAIYFIDNGANLKAPDIDGRTPLHVLANKKALGLWNNDCGLIVNKILGQGIKYDQVPIAAAFGTLQDVKMLVDSGCDVDDFLEFSYRNALLIATFLNNKEMLKYLLSKTRNINWEDYENKTAIDIATDEEIILLLRKAGAKSNDEIVDSINHVQSEVRNYQEGLYYGEALLEASKNGDYDKVREIITMPVEKGGLLLLRFTAHNKEGKSALHLAAENGHIAIVECLLSQGMRINIEDLSRTTPAIIKELIGKYIS